MALAGLVLASAFACSRSDPKPGPSASTSATSASGSVTGTSASAAPSASGLVLPSVTSASIATSNLDGEVDYARKKTDGGDATALARLVDRLLLRAQYTSSDADLTEADERTKKDVAAHPKDGAAHQRRASALSALHEFAGAEAELDLAVANGVGREATGRARAAIALARGDYERAGELLGSPEGASIDVLPLLGALAQHEGRAAEGDGLFERARTTYRDVSPFFVAWMDFERGRALERSGDSKRAKLYFREAVTILPTYAHAVVHLAVLENPSEALSVLAPLEPSNEADVLAAKAEAHRRSETPEADQRTAAAKDRFVALLRTHRAAYADHAASFFLGAGKDVPQALVLARENAALRPNEEALELWLTAAEAAKNKTDRCAAAAKIAAYRWSPAELRTRAAATSKDCP